VGRISRQPPARRRTLLCRFPLCEV